MNDLLSEISGISSRAMFGGYGIYRDGIIFAIIAYDELYFKVTDYNRTDYEKAGSTPFVYGEGNHKPTTMSYYKVPEFVLEDKTEMIIWVAKSVEASKLAKKK